MTTKEDQFQFWLMEMSEAIERFFRSIEPDVAARLDFSPESLKELENLALATYPHIDDLKKPSESKMVDGMARYVGEVFRKNLGGKWFIDYSDEKNAFYGLPQLKEMKGQRTQICPLTLVSASTDRRSGEFITKVFNNIYKNSQS